MVVCWSAEDVIVAISALPSSSLLPVRTVVVPSARMADDLRMRLVEAGRGELLAGTRFLTPDVLASAVLRRADVAVAPGEDELRRYRIAQLVAAGIDPPGLGRKLLQETVGWAAAFASTIGELERADLRPSDLPEDDVRLVGVRTVWEAADAAAGTSWTFARVLGHAARLLAADPSLVNQDSSFLAIVRVDEDAVVARFVRALPGASIAVLGARPVRAHVVERAIALFGDDARDGLLRAHPGLQSMTDLGVAAAHLFAFEQGLGGADRHRAGEHPDGTLMLEEFDGVAAEIDAAVDWVVRRILAGTAVERIALLAPVAEPWCTLLANRLRALGPGVPAPHVRVAAGLPLLHSAAGARVQSVARALQQHLGATAMAEVLGCVRAEDDQGRRPSRTRIRELVFSLGTRGGSAGNPGGALEWSAKMMEAEARLSAASTGEGCDEDEYAARRRERSLSTTRALRTAVDALSTVAEALTRGATLAEIRPLLIGFIRDHVAQPGDGPRAFALLDERLEILTLDETCGRISGPAVLELVTELLSTIRIFDDSRAPGVYVGTVASAAGLSFDAVRIVGLAEGSIPTTVRGDPALPDELRLRISPLLGTGADRALESLHAFDLVMRGVSQTLSLSASRLAIDRTVREPSSVFVEVGAALGRPVADGNVVPSLESLRRTDIQPSLARSERARIELPCRPADWHDRLAVGHVDVPRLWCDGSAIDLAHMVEAAPRQDAWHPLDGAIGHVPGSYMPGLDADHPSSAWRLTVLLRCPHRFLYEHVLRWEEPTEPPPGHELDPATFGALVHGVAEAFFRAHRVAFGERREDLETWRRTARQIAEAKLSELLVTYGLDSSLASAAMLSRLQTHVDRLLAQLWSARSRRFVATEWSFGDSTPLRLATETGDLYLRGRIDLIEASDEQAVVRDIKTGKCTPRRGRDSDPIPTTDLQIGLYAHIVAMEAASLGTPPHVGGAYVHTDDRRGSERAFLDADSDALRGATLKWLAAARDLLEARMFPRTPDPQDCNYCPFRPMCGDETRTRSARLMAEVGTSAVVRYRALKVSP